MIVQKINKTRYHESVSPDRAVESGVLAMVDGVYIVLYCISNMPLPSSWCDPPHALWTAMLRRSRSLFAFLHHIIYYAICIVSVHMTHATGLTMQQRHNIHDFITARIQRAQRHRRAASVRVVTAQPVYTRGMYHKKRRATTRPFRAPTRPAARLFTSPRQ